MHRRDERVEVRGLPPAAVHHRARGTVVVAVLLARTVLAVAIACWLVALAPALVGMRLTTVMSDSMAPSLLTGDAVVVRPVSAEEARVGQVLLVDDPDHRGRLRLHRFVERHGSELVLRGDANAAADSTPIEPEQVRAAAVLRVPFAGLPDYWLQTGALVPLGLFVAALAGLALLACMDIRPPPEQVPIAQRRAVLARFLRSRRARAVGVPALLLVAALTASSTVATAAGQGWAVFSGVATSNANTIGANSLFTNCPARPSGLPTPAIQYAYTANAGTTETDLAGSSNGTIASATLRTAGWCDGTGWSPYLTLTSPTATTVVSQGGRISPPAAFSISLWMNPANAGTGILADFTNSNGVGNQNWTDRQIYYKTDGTLTFGARFGTGTGTPVTCSTSAPVSGTWHHIVGTATSGGVLTLYVDGAQACTVTGTGYAPNAALSGGFWSWGAERPVGATAWGESSTSTGFVGGLDETTIYNGAITATDVSNLYAAGH